MPKSNRIVPFVEWLEDRATPSAGTLDLSFNGIGRQIIPFNLPNAEPDFGYDVVVQPDGRSVIVGFSSGKNGNHSLATRLLTNGQLDPDFGSGGRVNFDFEPGVMNLDDVRAVALQGTKILIAGSIRHETPPNPIPSYNYDFAVARLNSDGSLDSTFGTNGRVIVPFELGFIGGSNEDRLHDIVVDSKNRILLIGHVSTTNHFRSFGVARLTADGKLDTSFDGDGKTIVEFPNQAGDLIPYGGAIGSGGQIVLAGTIQNGAGGSGQYDNALAMLTDSGSLVTTFGINGRTQLSFDTNGGFEEFRAVTFDSSDNILAGGITPSADDVSDASVVRLTPTGSLDTTFNGNGFVRLAFDRGFGAWNFEGTEGVFVDGSGRIVAGGSVSVILNGNQSGSDSFVTRILSSGKLDADFGIGGTTFVSFDAESGDLTDFGTGLGSAPGGKIVIAGSTFRGATNGSYDFSIARLNGDGNTAPTISDVADQSSTGSLVGPLAFSVGDAETAASSLSVTRSSSNTTLLPLANIVLGGTGANRTVTVTPVAGQTGSTTVTLTVTDAGGLTATDTFVLTVTTPNTPPTISDVINQSSTGSPVGPLAFTVGDAQTAAGALSVTPSSSNTTLLPLANILLGGSGANRTVTVSPAAGQFGTATVTLTVTDEGGLTATDTFVLTVTNPNSGSPPMLIGFKQFSVGADAGDDSVNFYNPDGTVRFTLTPFFGQPGGVRTSAGDFTGDGIADLVVGTGPGGSTHVKVFNGVTQAELFSVDPFEATFTGGVYVAAGDINGDGIADLAITPDEGGGPRVRVFNGSNFTQIADFFGIDDPNFRGGARATIGDLNGDGRGDLVVVAGFGGGPRVAAFDGKQMQSNGGPKFFNDFFAFEQTLRNGIFVAAGDVNGDGFADLVAGGGPGGGPRVFILDGKSLVQIGSGTLVPVGNFFAGNPANRGGVRIAIKNLDNDNKADVVTGAGTGAGSRVTAYLGTNFTPSGTPPAFLDFDAFAGLTGGVFVG